MKPENPYRKDSLQWKLMEGDWSDLTIEQISEVLVCGVETTRALMNNIKRKTGYVVPYTKQKRRKVHELYGAYR